MRTEFVVVPLPFFANSPIKVIRTSRPVLVAIVEVDHTIIANHTAALNHWMVNGGKDGHTDSPSKVRTSFPTFCLSEDLSSWSTGFVQSLLLNILQPWGRNVSVGLHIGLKTGSTFFRRCICCNICCLIILTKVRSLRSSPVRSREVPSNFSAIWFSSRSTGFRPSPLLNILHAWWWNVSVGSDIGLKTGRRKNNPAVS